MVAIDPKNFSVSNTLSKRQLSSPENLFSNNSIIQQPVYNEDSYGQNTKQDSKHTSFFGGIFQSIKESGLNILNHLRGVETENSQSQIFNNSNPNLRTIKDGWIDNALANKTVNLNGTDKNQRINILSGISQLDNIGKTSGDNSRCGATAVTAAVIYSQGDKGLINLIDTIKSTNKNWNVNLNLSKYNLDQIKMNLQSGKSISRNDISLIQDSLYQVLNSSEINNHPYLQVGTLNHFINSNSSLSQAFSGENMQIKLVDINKNGTADHYVLFLNNQNKNLVYDPWPRGEGKQVIADNNTINLYSSSVVT